MSTLYTSNKIRIRDFVLVPKETQTLFITRKTTNYFNSFLSKQCFDDLNINCTYPHSLHEQQGHAYAALHSLDWRTKAIYNPIYHQSRWARLLLNAVALLLIARYANQRDNNTNPLLAEKYQCRVAKIGAASLSAASMRTDMFLRKYALGYVMCNVALRKLRFITHYTTLR